MQEKRAGRLAPLILLLVISLISLGAVETVLRLVLPRHAPASARHRVPHPELGWSLEPRARYTYRIPEGDVEVRYSSLGWHDEERAVQKTDGVRRIAVLGDSFMEAYSVPREASFAHRLEGDLRADGFEVEVLNFGVGGYGTLQATLAFESEVRRFAPDLVVLGFYAGNDLRNNSRELESMLVGMEAKVSSRPFYHRRSDGSWRRSTLDYDAATERFEAAREAESSWRARILRASAIARNVAYVVSVVSRSESDESMRRYLLALYGAHFCDEPLPYTQAWRGTEAILTRLRDAVDDAGAELLVMTVPGMAEVDARYGDFVRGQFDRDEVVCLEEPPAYARLEAILDELGVEGLDLLPSFQETATAGGPPLFHVSDRHWNERGHALAARDAAALIAARWRAEAPGTEAASEAMP